MTLCAALYVVLGLVGGLSPGTVGTAAACADTDKICMQQACSSDPNGKDCIKYKCDINPAQKICVDIFCSADANSTNCTQAKCAADPSSSACQSSSSSGGATITGDPSLVNGAKCDPSDPTKCVVAPCSKDNLHPPKSCDLSNCTNNNCDLITRYVNPAINVLSIGAGLAAIVGIIYGGIEYASSGGDPQQSASGKRHVKIAIIAIVAYLFLLTGLRFLIPGSVLLLGG